MTSAESSQPSSPGRYAKGAAKRREILDAALAVVAEQGYRNSTLQEIADAVGLTKAGVLHYFDSREDLLAEVLRERDRLDITSLRADGDAVDLLSASVAHNATVPGFVQLYSRVVVESADTEHPAHDYIADRYLDVVGLLTDALIARHAAGTIRSDVDPAVAARMLTALSDGLQLQWLYDESIDMRAEFDVLVRLLST